MRVSAHLMDGTMIEVRENELHTDLFVVDLGDFSSGALSISMSGATLDRLAATIQQCRGVVYDAERERLDDVDIRHSETLEWLRHLQSVDHTTVDVSAVIELLQVEDGEQG